MVAVYNPSQLWKTSLSHHLNESSIRGGLDWWAGLETEHDKHGNLDSDEARQAAARGKRNHLNEVL